MDADSEGISVGKKEKKMGISRSPIPLRLRSMMFEFLLQNRIGAEGEGFKIFMKGLSYARPMVGAQSLGIAQGAYEEALQYAKERKQFGKPIANFQAIQFMFSGYGYEY